MWSRKTNYLLFSFSFWIAHGSYLSSTYTILSLTQGTASDCRWAGPHLLSLTHPLSITLSQFYSITHSLSLSLSLSYSLSLSLFLSLTLSLSFSLSPAFSLSLSHPISYPTSLSHSLPPSLYVSLTLSPSHSLPPSLYVSLTLSLTLPLFLTPFLSQMFLLINQIPPHFSWPHSFLSLWDVFIWQWLREGMFCAALLGL